jgi:hypothetical protein
MDKTLFSAKYKQFLTQILHAYPGEPLGKDEG